MISATASHFSMYSKLSCGLASPSLMLFGEINLELANMSSPGTSSFIGEFPISVGAFQRNSLVATLPALGMILGAAYSLWLYNRVISGNLKPDLLNSS
ncbi:unnamed protein product [Lupinus luteus]|uniref:NADH-ubiquinone oxidoreductase chain 4 n=1 Tax=Lupinus luteus TaxID=3873 RepID=A0AAV1XN52_LUPLU